MIFGINNTSDISKLLYVILRAVRRVKFETILKYHEWYLCQISRTNPAIICSYYYRKRFVIFTCRYFILSWNITALSQSNCRNFSSSSIGFVQIFGCKIQDFFPEFFQTQGYQMTNERSLEAKPLDKWRSQGFPAMQCKRTVTIWQCRHEWFGYGRD